MNFCGLFRPGFMNFLLWRRVGSVAGVGWVGVGGGWVAGWLGGCVCARVGG